MHFSAESDIFTKNNKLPIDSSMPQKEQNHSSIQTVELAGGLFFQKQRRFLSGKMILEKSHERQEKNRGVENYVENVKKSVRHGIFSNRRQRTTSFLFIIRIKTAEKPMCLTNGIIQYTNIKTEK